MSKVHVETTINDEAIEFLCEPNQPLLEVLRDTLGLTGTKRGVRQVTAGLARHT